MKHSYSFLCNLFKTLSCQKIKQFKAIRNLKKFQFSRLFQQRMSYEYDYKTELENRIKKEQLEKIKNYYRKYRYLYMFSSLIILSTIACFILGTINFCLHNLG